MMMMVGAYVIGARRLLTEEFFLLSLHVPVCLWLHVVFVVLAALMG